MSGFSIDINALKNVNNSLAGIESKIRQAQEETRQVRNNLRIESVSALAVKASLQIQIMNMGSLNRKVGRYNEALREIQRLYALAEEKIKNNALMKANMKDCVHLPDGKSRLDAGTEEKDSAIRDFEKDHPEEAKKLNDFLNSGKNNNLTDEDKRNIKYLIYTAKEPYRSIYLNNLDKIKIGDGDLGDGAFYSNGKINLSYPESFKNDPRGPYTTFFHEYGHGIDDRADFSSKGKYDTETYKIYNEKMGREVTLREAIEHDVYYNKDNPHSISSMAENIRQSGRSGSKGNVDNVINAFKNGSADGLNKDDRALYNAVRNEFNRTTGNGTTYEAVTDVYGGMSRNALRNNGYGHDTDYWNNTSMPAKELWAEYFSYNMAGEQTNLDYVREYFPEAVKIMDQYALEMGG